MDFGSLEFILLNHNIAIYYSIFSNIYLQATQHIINYFRFKFRLLLNLDYLLTIKLLLSLPMMHLKNAFCILFLKNK